MALAGSHCRRFSAARWLPLCTVKVHFPHPGAGIQPDPRMQLPGAVAAEPKSAGGDAERVPGAQGWVVAGNGLVEVNGHRLRRSDLPVGRRARKRSAPPCTLFEHMSVCYRCDRAPVLFSVREHAQQRRRRPAGPHPVDVAALRAGPGDHLGASPAVQAQPGPIPRGLHDRRSLFRADVAASARDVRGALQAGVDPIRLIRPGHDIDPTGPRPTRQVTALDALADYLAKGLPPPE